MIRQQLGERGCQLHNGPRQHHAEEVIEPSRGGVQRFYEVGMRVAQD
jgi:hypothetical protein